MRTRNRTRAEIREAVRLALTDELKDALQVALDAGLPQYEALEVHGALHQLRNDGLAHAEDVKQPCPQCGGWGQIKRLHWARPKKEQP